MLMLCKKERGGVGKLRTMVMGSKYTSYDTSVNVATDSDVTWITALHNQELMKMKDWIPRTHCGTYYQTSYLINPCCLW